MNFLRVFFILLLLPTLHVSSQCSVQQIRKNLEIGEKFKRSKPDKSENAAQLALNCAKKLEENRSISKALNIIGFHCLMEGKTVNAYSAFWRSLKISERIKNDTSIAIAQNNLGNYYNYLGLDEIALEYYLKSLKLKKKINLNNGIDVGLVNIGIIYDKQGKHKQAITFYEDALVFKKQKNDVQGEAICYENIGIAYAEMREFALATDFFDRALEIYEGHGNADGATGIKLSKAAMFIEMNDLQKSESLLSEIKTSVLSRRDISKVQLWYVTNLNLELANGNYSVALNAADSSLKYATFVQDIGAIIETHEGIAKVYSLAGNESMALKNINISLALKDSLNSINNQVAIEELQLRYETEVLNNRIEVQKKDIELLHLANRTKIYLILLIVLFALLIVWGVYRKYQRNLKIKNSLKTELNQRNKELLSFTVQTAKKNEAIQSLKEKLSSSEIRENVFNNREIKSLFSEVERTEDNWQEFRMRFEKIEPTFFDTLSKSFKLSETDLRICALIKLNVTTQETANMLNITAESVNKARYRLKKKLNLPKELDLNTFIRSHY